MVADDVCNPQLDGLDRFCFSVCDNLRKCMSDAGNMLLPLFEAVIVSKK